MKTLNLTTLLFVSSLLTLLAAFSTTSMAQTTENASPAVTYPVAPQWTLETQSGEQKSYADYKGKPLIITFWGTWCPYCKKLHPGLEKLHVKYAKQGLQVLGISVNEPIGADPEASLKSRGITFETLVEGDDVALEQFEIVGTPSTVFISPDGKILGSTMESNPDDPRFEQIAAYLVSLPQG
jgi:thiol-disulfide isomerase/thioredoxin